MLDKLLTAIDPYATSRPPGPKHGTFTVCTAVPDGIKFFWKTSPKGVHILNVPTCDLVYITVHSRICT